MIVGFSWKRNIPTLGELRNPISLVRSSRVPDNVDGLSMTLTLVWNSWAKVDVMNGRTNNGESSSEQSEITHSVILRRHEGIAEPEVRDFIIYKNRMLRIIEFRELDQRAFYWIIACNDEGATTSWRYDNPATPENPNLDELRDDPTTGEPIFNGALPPVEGDDPFVEGEDVESGFAFWR